MEKQPKGYVAAFDDRDAAAAFRQVFETGKVTETTTTTKTTKKKNDNDRNAGGRTKETSNNTKYAATPMARARHERRNEEMKKVDGPSDSSSSPESTNNNNNNNEFFVAEGGGILSKTSSLDAPIMNGVGSFDKLESSSTPSSGEGASVHSDKSERSEKSAMYQARAAKAARARESSSVSATTMGEEDGGEGEGEGGTGGTPLKAGRFNRHLKDASGNGAGHLPKFGDWNSKPPTASGPGYTVLFKAASKERRAGGSVRVPPSRPGSESPPRTGDLYKLVPGRRPKKPNKLFCCIISTVIE